jgi:endopeptidase La
MDFNLKLPVLITSTSTVLLPGIISKFTIRNYEKLDDYVIVIPTIKIKNNVTFFISNIEELFPFGVLARIHKYNQRQIIVQGIKRIKWKNPSIDRINTIIDNNNGSINTKDDTSMDSNSGGSIDGITSSTSMNTNSSTSMNTNSSTSRDGTTTTSRDGTTTTSRDGTTTNSRVGTTTTSTSMNSTSTNSTSRDGNNADDCTIKEFRFVEFDVLNDEIDENDIELKSILKSFENEANFIQSLGLKKGNPIQLADLIVTIINTSYNDKLKVLELPVKQRLIFIIELSKKQFIRKQDSQLETKLKQLKLPESIRDITNKELSRLKRLNSSMAEYHTITNYLDWIIDLPWESHSNPIDIQYAKTSLDKDHYSLDTVKSRIIEYLSVRKLKNDLKGPILCLLGPPGVGKTSLGKSIANALGRKFYRIALGGVRDEAEIRGHRKTYVGAMPGLFIQALKRCGVNNPVILLDEIDKVGRDSRGDPTFALLEVLDPEQNQFFTDHYLNFPFDLSNVLFIATANDKDCIPAPLLDRMELLQLSGYTVDEKINIARNHLLPKQIQAHGLPEDGLNISDEILEKIITEYTREPGVRNLEREIAAICRSFAVDYSSSPEYFKGTVTSEKINDILGTLVYTNTIAQHGNIPGVVTGLAWTASGSGDVLFIETSSCLGSGKLLQTGIN